VRGVRTLGVLIAGALAITAIFVLPADVGFGVDVPEADWAEPWAQLILQATVLVLVVVSALTASRVAGEAALLGLLLSMVGLGVSFAAVNDEALPPLLSGRGVGWVLWFVTGWVWIRFCAAFPARATHTAMVEFMTRTRVLEPGWDSPRAGRSYKALTTTAATRFPRLTEVQRRLRRPFIRLEEKRLRAAVQPIDPEVASKKADRMLGLVRLVPLLALLGAFLGVVSATREIRWLAPALFFGLWSMLVIGNMLAAVGFSATDDAARRRALWVYQGLAFPLVLVTVVPGTVVVVIWLTGAPLGLIGITDLIAASAPLYLTASVLVGVFWEGAVDPRLAIRRTALFGGLSVVLLFMFGALEVVLSDYVLAAAGAPSGAGAWVAGGGVALAFGPIRERMKTGIDRWIDERLPATELGAAPRHPAVVAFSDIVGYTALTSENEDDALAMMSVFHRQARRAAEQSKGRLVKTMGDGVIMEFKDGASAVAAAQQLTSSFSDACEPLGLPEGQLRTGIHFGEVAKRRDGDLFGDAVNIASRLEGIAEPGQIVVSQAVADQLDVALDDLGERSLKNVPELVRCWAVNT